MPTTQSSTSSEKTGSQNKSPIFARKIADALERYLEAANTSVHWVTATGDASSFKAPTAIWPEGDFAVRICVSEGSSEGSRIEVMYEVNREPFESLPLLRVKTLSGIKRAFEEAFHVYEFMSALDLDLYREGVIEASAA